MLSKTDKKRLKTHLPHNFVETIVQETADDGVTQSNGSPFNWQYVQSWFNGKRTNTILKQFLEDRHERHEKALQITTRNAQVLTAHQKSA